MEKDIIVQCPACGGTRFNCLDTVINAVDIIGWEKMDDGRLSPIYGDNNVTHWDSATPLPKPYECRGCRATFETLQEHSAHEVDPNPRTSVQMPPELRREGYRMEFGTDEDSAHLRGRYWFTCMRSGWGEPECGDVHDTPEGAIADARAKHEREMALGERAYAA